MVVHLLPYGLDMQTPSMEVARACANHYGLAERPNHIVLVGDKCMLSSETMRMIPGLHLVDPDFRLRMDAAGRSAAHDLWTELWPGLATVLDEVHPRAY